MKRKKQLLKGSGASSIVIDNLAVFVNRRKVVDNGIAANYENGR